MITLRLPGQPVSQLRAKAATRRGKDGQFHARVYEPAKSARHKAALATEARRRFNGNPLEGPLSVEILFVFRCPVSDRRVKAPTPRRPHDKKPDLDNLVKMVDAFNGLLWRDDAQIVELQACKIIGAQDEEPHTLIKVAPFVADVSDSATFRAA